ncbi:MAG: hypothetical protein UZ07_CHB004002566, partial [Chlorobi bacterium OLB7]
GGKEGNKPKNDPKPATSTQLVAAWRFYQNDIQRKNSFASIEILLVTSYSCKGLQVLAA